MNAGLLDLAEAKTPPRAQVQLDGQKIHLPMPLTFRPDRWAAARAGTQVYTVPRSKRCFDVVLGSLILVAVLPIILFFAIAIIVSMRCWPIFAQRRTGLNGEVFTIYKLRSLCVAEDGDAVAAVGARDPRITGLGKLLRKLWIDELPQLWNVIRGDMSLIGPRPHAIAHDRYYGALIPTYSKRFRLPPGMTGLAQVRGYQGMIHSLRDMEARIDSDNDFADHWSLKQDVAFLLRTVVMMLHPIGGGPSTPRRSGRLLPAND
jgi:putative colanic acid biosynthesis UDP-glucose lipid carrier transferase